MDKKFGDLKLGDYIYLLRDLEVKELKITKIIQYTSAIGLETDGGPDQWMVEESARNSYSYGNTIFIDSERAMEVLKEKVSRRLTELQDKIDQEIIEFDKLEKFLDNVKGKKLW